MHIEFDGPREYWPKKATKGSAGWDLFATEDRKIWPGESVSFNTLIKVKIPDNCVGLVIGRSGLAFGHGIDCHIGVIDSDYEGEIHVLLSNNRKSGWYEVKKGDRIAQLIIVSCAEIDEEHRREEKERGGSGFGSTGK